MLETYVSGPVRLTSTETFNKWFGKLTDFTVKQQLLARFAGGLRIYYAFRGEKVILLLTGGDKSSQAKDIAKAEQILTNME